MGNHEVGRNSYRGAGFRPGVGMAPSVNCSRLGWSSSMVTSGGHATPAVGLQRCLPLRGLGLPEVSRRCLYRARTRRPTTMTSFVRYCRRSASQAQRKRTFVRSPARCPQLARSAPLGVMPRPQVLVPMRPIARSCVQLCRSMEAYRSRPVASAVDVRNYGSAGLVPAFNAEIPTARARSWLRHPWLMRLCVDCRRPACVASVPFGTSSLAGGPASSVPRVTSSCGGHSRGGFASASALGSYARLRCDSGPWLPRVLRRRGASARCARAPVLPKSCVGELRRRAHPLPQQIRCARHTGV